MLGSASMGTLRNKSQADCLSLVKKEGSSGKCGENVSWVICSTVLRVVFPLLVEFTVSLTFFSFFLDIFRRIPSLAACLIVNSFGINKPQFLQPLRLNFFQLKEINKKQA